MALVICIPLVLVVGTYDLKMVVTVSTVQFALFFTDFWFQLARWIDSTILDALYGWGFGWNRPHTNFDPLVGLNNAFGDMLLMFVNEIGRASCRDRVCQYVSLSLVAGSLKKKN